MIVPLYKPVGASTHQLAAKLGRLYGEKATHTGTLDPMADGVVIGLTGPDRFHKASYSDWRKTYQFKLLVGVATDSHDLLGLITQQQFDDLPPLAQLGPQIELALANFSGSYDQQLPDFSARRLAGSSFMHQARQGRAIPATFEQVSIFATEVNDSTTISAQDLTNYCQQTIGLVQGDFRQPEILAQWRVLESKLPLFTITVQTSKRTYIRALVRDLAQQIGLPATAMTITRTANGPYQIQDCLCLV
jgi:tRNA pseudouridine55 synthase